MEKQPNSRYCFMCGVENPLGPKLAFYQDDMSRVIAHFSPRDEYQGYPGLLHGGIACAVLDEIIGRTTTLANIWTMTVTLNVRFRKPIPLGQRLTVVAELTRMRSRTVEGKGEIRLADGTVAATAEAKYIRMTDDQVDAFHEDLGFWQVIPDAKGEGEGEGESPLSGNPE